MRLSAKGRYALAALIEMARQTQKGGIVSLVSISEILGISKIFLEQIATTLKKDGIILSTKGARGGYQLAREAHTITALDVLASVENTLMENNAAFGPSSAIETAIRAMVFDRLDQAIETCLSGVSIQDLLEYADRQNSEQAFMANI
ncbi:MAG: Rrf2 family transcriptional regulator [Betaproteobacteria bacterium]|nr:Rrf2 family transcriptional regulator [Betaproteobacteria bacterium]MCL2886222.1 Rrf2 family transcriptional regulator [Betaproteobacteria bacterium]